MQVTSCEKTSEDRGNDSHPSSSARAFAKIFAARPSREDLRAIMLEKSRRMVESGLGGLDYVVVREFR